MPEFMVMILPDEAEEGQLAPSETKALVEGHSAYERKLRAASAYLDGERLRPSAEGRRVSVRDGQAHMEAGPFAETLGGYYLLQAESLDAAVEFAQQCPMAPGTSLDVRPVMKGFVKPEKASQQGRVFAFAVLGNAPSEQGWIDGHGPHRRQHARQVPCRPIPRRRALARAGTRAPRDFGRGSARGFRRSVSREQGGHRRPLLHAHVQLWTRRYTGRGRPSS